MANIIEHILRQGLHPANPEYGCSVLGMEIDPDVLDARERHKSTKLYYSLMYQARKIGLTDFYDISSSVHLIDKEQEAATRRITDRAYVDSVNSGEFNSYPSAYGLTELRQAGADLFARWAGINLDPNDNLMVTAGIIDGIEAAISSPKITHVIRPDFSPYYVDSQARTLHKQVLEVPLDLHTGNLDLEVLEQILSQIEPGSALLYITTPSSPAGTLPQEGFMESLINLAVIRRLAIVSDSYVYATTFSGQPIRPLLSYPHAVRVGLEAIGVSKELSIPGVRAGVIAGNAKLINSMRVRATGLLRMLPAFNQRVAAYALNELEPDDTAIKISRELHNEILPRLAALNWPVTVMPQAGIDMALPLPSIFMSAPKSERSLLASLAIIDQYGVAFSPTCGYGDQGDNYLRIVLKQPCGVIPRALDHLLERGFNWETVSPPETLSQALAYCLANHDPTNL